MVFIFYFQTARFRKQGIAVLPVVRFHHTYTSKTRLKYFQIAKQLPTSIYWFYENVDSFPPKHRLVRWNSRPKQ